MGSLKEEISKQQKLTKQSKNREKMFEEYRKDFETMRNNEKENKKKTDLLAETKKIAELEEKIYDLESKAKKHEEENLKHKKTYENYHSLKKNKESLMNDNKKLEEENVSLKEEISK